MYLTDIRGFSAEEYMVCSIKDCDFSLCYGGEPLFFAKAKPMCKITIHGMGMQGNKGLSLHFARFCREFEIEPRFISVSDMGISFFVNTSEKAAILEALCEYFPIWE